MNCTYKEISTRKTEYFSDAEDGGGFEGEGGWKIRYSLKSLLEKEAKQFSDLISTAKGNNSRALNSLKRYYGSKLNLEKLSKTKRRQTYSMTPTTSIAPDLEN